MRNLRVRLEIDIYAIEHDPFAIRRRHRRADPLQFHHVFEGERTFCVCAGMASERNSNDEVKEWNQKF